MAGLLDLLPNPRAKVRFLRGLSLLLTGQRGARVSLRGSITSPADLDCERSIDYSLWVSEFLSRLIPKSDYSHALRRVGGSGDGGYWLPSVGFRSVISAGIGDDCAFEEQLAGQGAHVIAVDNSIHRLPSEASSISFFRKTVGPAGNGECDIHGLKALYLDSFDSGLEAALLKLDIEGAEWDVLGSAKELDVFDCIVLELHGLDDLADREFRSNAGLVIRALTTNHDPIAISANNCCGYSTIGGFAVPRVIEVTLVHSRILQGALGSADRPWDASQVSVNVPSYAPLHLDGLLSLAASVDRPT